MTRKTTRELLNWAEETQLVPDEDAARAVRGGQPGDMFAVALGEDAEGRRSPGERYSISAARVAALDGKVRPMKDEPFTEYFARERFAGERLRELGDELDCSTTRR